MKLDFEVKKDCCHFEEFSEPHFHDEYEVLVGLSDGGTFFINGHAYPLCHGMLFVLGRGVLHQCLANISSYEKYILHFPAETLKGISSSQTDLERQLNSRAYTAVLLGEEQLDNLCRMISDCMAQEGFGADLRRDIAFMQLVLLISGLIESDDGAVHPALPREYAKIMPIIEFVHGHYAEEISLEQISQQFFISKFHLCRRFKALTGFSVGAYITNYRIRQACVLLRKGISVQRAGEEVGFGNNAHFVRTFGKIIGTSPGRYAKTY